MTRFTDVAVIGGGIVGLATAYALHERGASVTVYERGVPGHGQSGGATRIFRHAHDDVRLVAFARDSRAVWDEWGQRAGAQLLAADGAIAIGPVVDERLSVLSAVGGVRARRIDADELTDRLPLLARYEGPALLDADGGAIRAHDTIAWLTGALGPALVADEVLSVRPLGGTAVEVRAGGACRTYPAAVVCAGVDTARLARGAGLSLPVTVEAHVRLTFAVRGAPPDRLPTVQDSSGTFGEAPTYGGPLAGNDRYAVGIGLTVGVQDDGGLEPTGLEDLGRRARAYVARAFPGLDPEPVGHRHCWVTRLPWGDDGLAVWEAPSLLFVAGNNLFKHAPGLGRALAGAALGDGLPGELRPEAVLGRSG